MPANATRTSVSERASNHGRSTAASTSRIWNRSDTDCRSMPIACSIAPTRASKPGDVAKRVPLASGERDHHHAPTIAVAKSWPKAPYR